MATPREIRRLGFQILFQLDAQGGEGAQGSLMEQWVNATEHAEGFTAKERAAALSVARSAYAERGKSDAAMLVLAPDWPAHRQAAPDRAILRLAHFEMTSGKAPPKAVIGDSIELAKEFSTDKSPAFVNALLDKVLRKQRAAVHGEEEDPAGTGGGEAVPAAG
ncbi:MAG: transcription antitermination protein NusB [Phycisphaerales bacterium]